MKFQCMWSLAVGFNVLSFLSILFVTKKIFLGISKEFSALHF